MTSEPRIPAPRESAETESLRYAEDIVALNSRLSWRGLIDAIAGEPLYSYRGNGDGLTTVVARESQIPKRYLYGIMGFRLAQFLRMGWMDPALAHRMALFHEPLTRHSPVDTIHTVTLTETGRIAGYIALVGSPDQVPLPLDAPGRQLFPAEIAHHVELLSTFAEPGLKTHQVYEIKRFVRDRDLPRGPQRDRVPWHLMLALCRVLTSQPEEFRIGLGDSREDGALRNLRLVGFEPLVVDDTKPSLPHTELMWPSYEQPKLAKPFATRVPANLGEYLDAMQSGLDLDPESDWQTGAIRQVVELHRLAGEKRAEERV